MLLNPLQDIFVYTLNLRIGLRVYGFQVVHCGSLEQANIAIMFSFGFVYIKSMNKVILDLAHSFLWGYILNPRFTHSV